MTAQVTAWEYHWSVGTSEKPLYALAEGEPAARHRKVTTCSRVQFLLGEKVVLLVPVVILMMVKRKKESN